MEKPTNGELKVMLDNLTSIVKEVREDGKITQEQAFKTNGRATALEKWSNESQVLIEAVRKQADETAAKHEKSRSNFMLAIGLVVFFGGTIVTLAITVENYRVEKAIGDKFSAIERRYNIEVNNK